jgi:hypothetical protein
LYCGSEILFLLPNLWLITLSFWCQRSSFLHKEHYIDIIGMACSIKSGNYLLTTTLLHIKCSHLMWHLWSPSKLIMPNRLNVATDSTGISKKHHIVRDVYFALPMCSTVEKTLCPFHYLDIMLNSFWSTGIFPSWPVVFRDHDFALNHKDIESTLQFDKKRHTHLLCRLTSLLVWISAPIVHWESVWEICWEEL